MVATGARSRAKANGEGAEEPIVAAGGGVPDEPTREEIFQAALMTARKTNRVPTLLGPTASGKTWLIESHAAEYNAEVVTVLLGQHTPDEIAGFQLNLDGQLVMQMPFWFTQAQHVLNQSKNVWLFFDELGLSREETRGALYTFFRDRHLHEQRLQPQPGFEVLLFAGSNPATFAPPFKSRCLFLGVPSDRDYLNTIAEGSDFVKKAVKLAPISDNKDPFYSNEAPPSPVVLDASAAKALRDLTKDADFWKLPEPARYIILSGLVPHQTLSQLLQDNTLDATALARNYLELERALKALPKDKMHSMINNVLACMPQLTTEERAEAIMSILDVIYNDPSGSDIQTYFATPHDDEIAAAVAEIDPEFMETRLKERNLLWTDTDSKGNKVAKGSFLERLQAMVDSDKSS